MSKTLFKKIILKTFLFIDSYKFSNKAIVKFMFEKKLRIFKVQA